MRHALAYAAALALASAPVRADPKPGLDDQLDAAEADDAEPAKDRTPWNELNLKLLTMRFGGGALFDWATYDQDAASQAQMPVHADQDLRDFRLLLKGKLLFFPRISYTVGYMYDQPNQQWRFRQTGLQLDLPELGGQLFVGRTKEGFSTNKLMVGYNGWTIERAAANEAFLPILADGIKWTGRLFDGKLVYNAGWFIDTLSESESFNKNDKQFAARTVFLPIESDTVLHIAAEARYGASDDDFLQFKSKPESFVAQSFAVDTGKFAAESTTMAGFELYYRPGPFMFGSEYFLNWVQSREEHDPFFHGGEAFVSYLFTGEVHPYNEKGAFFEGVVPKKSVIDGGLGAWEVAMRFSYVDLDSRAIEGGKFWRLTPVVNWYVTKFIRLEAEYGYSKLDRDAMTGTTQYFQARLQLQFM